MRPTIIGITGGIGGGKSLFSSHLLRRGEWVYNADVEAKRIQNLDMTVRQKIQEAFGRDIYTTDGLDRAKLAKIVFADPAKLQTLNSIVHPAVIADFERWVEQNSDRRYLFIESAILFEAHIQQLVDKVLVVTAPEPVRIKRVTARDGVSADAVRARMRYQLPEEEKIARADWVFDTSDTMLPHERVDLFLNMLSDLS